MVPESVGLVLHLQEHNLLRDLEFQSSILIAHGQVPQPDCLHLDLKRHQSQTLINPNLKLNPATLQLKYRQVDDELAGGHRKGIETKVQGRAVYGKGFV